MTRAQIEHEATRLIAAGKASVELQGDFPITIMLHAGFGWHRFPFPKEFEFLMNSGKAKDRIFETVRQFVRDAAADAVIFMTDTWRAETTEEGAKHYDTPEWRELHDTGFVKLVQRGWVKRCEAFCLTAQTPDAVFIVQQKYQRLPSGVIQLLDSKREWLDQANFGGRQKMFGDLRWENLGSADATKGTQKGSA